MKSILKYFVVAIVAICYLQAALEINEGPIHNTFGDDCDTYIHSDNTNYVTLSQIEQAKDFALLPDTVFYCGGSVIYRVSAFFQKRRTFTAAQLKLYLSHCSFLI